ncbi:suppressor of tumorigenicity 14 protein [Ambystoma mexicanum]|uniref:suppressor of tumorigenicity 14 protein n=1 Tax=Ambystoma mexicanum TaxID=8296 RepID=UPI0037E95216
MKSFDAGLMYNPKTEKMNGFEEEVEFLPAMNAKKVEKRGLKSKLCIAAVVIGTLLVSLTISLLVWHFTFRNVKTEKIFTGYLRVTNVKFMDAYENSSSPEFLILANKVKDVLKMTYQSNPAIWPHFRQADVTAFSEGSVIAYYWVEFGVPKYLEEDFDKGMASLKAIPQDVKVRKNILIVDSIKTYPVDLRMLKDPKDNTCKFGVHAKVGTKTTFSTPGFPNSPYPPNTNCQWILRADIDHVISLSFRTFHLEQCQVKDNDYVKIYDSLSPAEPRAIVSLCGSYPSSYNLTFLSSQNVMLVSLVTNGVGRHPGFMAEFIQLPKKTPICGGTFKEVNGNISSPYYPGHYPPDFDCTWDIQVPNNKNVKVRFNFFYLVEPGTALGSCTKDYVEVNGQRYCGTRSQFVVSSSNSKISVRFHSDKSYTDTGFLAEYLSYEPNNPCPEQFTCKSGRCIKKDLQCDGWNDCGDFSDELGCNCTADQFRCKASQLCKPRYWKCDGVNDCGDESDELECQCPALTYKCGNGKCIPEAQKCDKINQCGDGTDESDCGPVVPVNCLSYTYKCSNNQCINKLNPECDGEPDCTDGSDEASCSCGMRPFSRKTRIVGGTNADVGEWPWQVSLHTKAEGHTCGASVVSETWLVSAAHCFQNDGPRRYSDPSLWTAYLGLHDQAQRSSSEVRKIKRIIAHRSFNDYTYDHDIAVLELESPVQYTNVIQPICLPDPTHYFPVGKSFWVTGWGALKEGGSGAVVLQKAEIRLINQTECNRVMDNQLTARMMCAGFLSGGIDACQGDSGGPLSSVDLNSSKMYLAGVVSWGDGCARRNKPGIYTRVTMLRDWIKQHTGL